jgi:glycerophosphoryl diester phosphodiesterase
MFFVQRNIGVLLAVMALALAGPGCSGDERQLPDGGDGFDGDVSEGDLPGDAPKDGTAHDADGGEGDYGDYADEGSSEDGDGFDGGENADDGGGDQADGDGEVGDGDPGTDRTADGGDGGGDSWRSSLAVCWTDAECPRVMAVGHGGMWDLTSAPYNSDAAIAAAYAGGMDGVKIDVRVTADNVPVIAHSSPIEIWESVGCSGQKIEEMTADEVTACHRFPSTTENFQRLDDVLEYLRGKMVVQLCVKEEVDYGRTIEEIITRGAEDFAFIELSTSDLQYIVSTLPGNESVWYLVNVGSNLAEVDTIIDVIQNPRGFMIEIDPDVDIGDLTASRIHPAGLRTFTYQDAELATVAMLQALFEKGFDVVSANAGANAVEARINVNQSRGVDPP